MVDFTTPHVDDAGKKGDYYNYGCASVLHIGTVVKSPPQKTDLINGLNIRMFKRWLCSFLYFLLA